MSRLMRWCVPNDVLAPTFADWWALHSDIMASLLWAQARSLERFRISVERLRRGTR